MMNKWDMLLIYVPLATTLSITFFIMLKYRRNISKLLNITLPAFKKNEEFRDLTPIVKIEILSELKIITFKSIVKILISTLLIVPLIFLLNDAGFVKIVLVSALIIFLIFQYEIFKSKINDLLDISNL